MAANDFITFIQILGFPISCVIACAFFIYKVTIRDKNEAHDREEELIEANRLNSEALSKVANTIAESNKINKELSETNRLLVDKIEGRLEDIDNNIHKVVGKLGI